MSTPTVSQARASIRARLDELGLAGTRPNMPTIVGPSCGWWLWVDVNGRQVAVAHADWTEHPQLVDGYHLWWLNGGRDIARVDSIDAVVDVLATLARETIEVAA